MSDQSFTASARPELTAELPFSTPRNLSVGGRLKVEPEDFVVDEIPAYEPSGTGEHLFLQVQKRDISAEFLSGHVAKSLGIHREDIGVAGLKDRRAVTRQWISVPLSAEPRVAAINSDSVQVLQAIPHGNKLRTGHLRGNRFEIILRDIRPDLFSQAEQLRDIIRDRGVPNYFGEQRFGNDGETLDLGLSLLRGEASTQNIPARRRKFLTRLALSAAQSMLFNEIVARRLRSATLHTVHPGDVMQVTASGGLFVVEHQQIEQQRFDRRETVITGPIFGPKMKPPQGQVAGWESDVLQSAGFTMDVFRANKKLTPGTRRPLLLWPDALDVSMVPSGLKLSFALPSGSYATIVLREFMKTGS